MAKSKIIKDLANSTVDVMAALKRAKVLFAELNNEELLNWVNYELMGYPPGADLPDYRIEHGTLRGSYFKGSMAQHMKWTDVSIPLGKMPEDLKKDILEVQFRESVSALKQLSETNENGRLEKIIPADFFPAIATFNNDPYMIIIAARVVVGAQCIPNIFSVIENRLLDALIIMEKEFGNLDDLDIDISQKTNDELQEIIKNLYVIIYNNQSVNIGDNNKIKDSQIASTIEEIVQ